jgi:hypothetical protein
MPRERSWIASMRSARAASAKDLAEGFLRFQAW